MDLEQLSKHQIILLTFLVALITAVTTGIVTVSLIGQAPPSVTRTVNQIVERTVQQVVPSTDTTPTKTVTEKTIIVKEDDAMSKAIATVQGSSVRIVTGTDNNVLARGIAISTHTVLTDAASLDGYKAGSLSLQLPDKSIVPITSFGTASSTAFALITVASTTTLTPATIADSSKLTLGQTLLRVGGKSEDSVGTGLVATLPGMGKVDTTVSASTPGSVIFSLFGEVVGMTTGDSATDGATTYSLITADSLAPVAK